MSVEPPEFRGDLPETEAGGFYLSHAEGFDPVTIWVGRIGDDDVVSLIVRHVAGAGPVLDHAAFTKDAGLGGIVALTTPFEVDEAVFANACGVWDEAHAAGEAAIHDRSPNEIYAQLQADGEGRT